MARKNNRMKTEYHRGLGFDPRKYLSAPHYHYNPLPDCTPQRGDIWFASLGSHSNTSVQGGTRPVIIISNDIGNEHADTVNVVPMTRHMKKLDLPCHFKPIARFDRERGIWYVYDGKVWQPDENALAVEELAKILANRLYTFALQITDEDTRNRYIKRVQKLQMRKNRRTMIEDAKSVYPVPHSLCDHNTNLFNCQNGTLNLTTGEFRPHDPADFLTMMSGVTYNPDAACPRWEQFIS